MMSYIEREQRWQEFFDDTDHFQFAYLAKEENGHIVGFASGGVNRNDFPDYQGELYAIYILREYQGKGIGRQLTEAVASRLLRSGYWKGILHLDFMRHSVEKGCLRKK